MNNVNIKSWIDKYVFEAIRIVLLLIIVGLLWSISSSTREINVEVKKLTTGRQQVCNSNTSNPCGAEKMNQQNISSAISVFITEYPWKTFFLALIPILCAIVTFITCFIVYHRNS